MTQAQLEREVCHSLGGESREVVQKIGFSLLVPTNLKRPTMSSSRTLARILRLADYRRNRVAAKPA